MAVHGVGDIDLLKGDLQLIAQDLCIAAGALRGAEAGHGHSQHIPGGAAQLLHGTHGHQQRKTAVQAAGNADNGGLCVGVFQPLCKAVGLHFQNKLTAFGTALGIAGHKGRGIDPAGQHGLRRLQIELHGLIALTGRLKAGVAGTLGFHALAVDLGLGTAAVKGDVLRENGAVLGNEVMSGKHHVLRALTVPGGSIKVAAQQTGRLVGH